jgi:hypothetical protein
LFYRHYSDKLVYPILGFIVLLIASYRPVYHLRAKMPQEFYAPSIAGASTPSENERRIAQAYWQSAQLNVQWKHAQGQPLPVDVPGEFRIDPRAFGPASSDQAVRAFYWRRLQSVYTSPAAWQKEYQWNFGWINDTFSSIADWIRDAEKHVSFPGR